MTRSKLVLVSLAVLLMSGCISHLRPYKMDIRQGNYVSPEMREKLKLGMSKQQVRYVMGTPLLADAFHGDRWDYRYSFAEGGKLKEQQGMTLYFEGDTLARIDDAGMLPLPPQPAPEPVPVAASAVVETAAPVVAAPVPTPAETAETQVKASLAAWAAAWSARDSKAFLAAYAPDYKPAGMSRAAWQKQRTQRIAKAKSIAVTLSEVVVQMQDDSHANITFTQDYRADNYEDVEHKTVQMENRGDAWLIVAETVQK